MKKLIIIIPALILISLFCFAQDEEIKVDSISPYGPAEVSEPLTFEGTVEALTVKVADPSEDRVYQLDDFRDIVWALETLLKHCGPVSREWSTTTTEYVSPSAQLRRQADEMDQRDKDIIKAREVLKKWKDIQEALEEMHKDQIKRNTR